MNGPWRFTLLGYPAAWGRPLLLGLTLVAAALAALGVWSAQRRHRQLLDFLSERMLPRLAPGISGVRAIVEPLLSGLGLVLFALALAQPQCGGRTERIQRRGIDLVVALDASKSMRARDVAPSRLERAKLELSALLDQLKGDRVGIVVFAGDAFIQCPLTSDYAAARLFLRAVDPEQMPQGGTDIGAALALAGRVLAGAERGAKERVVLLLSDGEDLRGEAASSAEELRQAGVRVFAVGIGSESGEPIPVLGPNGAVTDYQRDEAGQVVLSKLDREGLAAIASATDGEFFYRADGVAVDEVVERIDRMQKSELEGRLAIQWDERYEAFAWPGVFFWVAGTWMRTARRRVA